MRNPTVPGREEWVIEMLVRKPSGHSLSIFLVIFSCLVLGTTLHGDDDIVAETRDLLRRYKQGEQVENGVQKFQSDPGVYAALRRGLLRIKDERTFPVFFAALNDTSERVRALAVRKMATFKKKEAVGPLVTILKSDPSVKVRSEAALCLGLMGYEEAGEYLLDALNDQESRVVRMAMRGLGRLKYQEAVEPLEEKLRGDNEKDWVVQWEAARALKEITGQDWSQGIHKFPPEMRVRDEQLTLQAYEEAMKFLKESLPEMLHEAETVEEVTSNARYYIGYFNSITTIQGYLLKQDVLLRKLQFERASQAKERGETEEGHVQKAKLDYDEASERYRYFLDNTGWFD
jgi:HEAT repeat protein